MPESADIHFNNGANPRERRPRVDGEPAAAALLGAVIGGVLLPGIGGIIGGGLAGAALGSGGPMPLEPAIRQLVEQASCTFVSLNHYGPFNVVLTFGRDDGYWTITSIADRSLHWTQVDLEDWLYGDIKQQFHQWLRGRQWT